MYDINAYNQMMQKLKGGIIVSCQSKEGDPTHCPEFMAAFAKSAEIGGAAGIRANSVVDIEAIKKITDLPVIGIWKRHWEDEWWNIMITPTFADCKELADGCGHHCHRNHRPQASEQRGCQRTGRPGPQ